MSKRFPYPLLFGLVSAGLFIAVMGLKLGFFFLFLPTLPILLLGLSKNARDAFMAVLVAGGVLIVAAGPEGGLLFLIFLGLPSWYITSRALLSYPTEPDRQWFPVGLIFAQLTLYACAVMAGIAWYYASQPGGIEQVIRQSMSAELSNLEGDYNTQVNIIAEQWPFLVFAMTVWLWGLALYAHGWLASRMLAARQKAIRPDFAMVPFAMPHGMLYLLAVCALASLIGSHALALIGKASFIALLLPYFFAGCAFMHAATKTWPSRRFFLFFIYFFIFGLLWPALIVAMVGLFKHIKALSSIAPSSK